MPRIVFSVVDLPEALPPSRQTSSPCRDLELDVLEDVDRPVERVDAAELEQRHQLGLRSAAEVRLDHQLVRRDLLERALGDLGAVVEGDDPVRDALDDVHVVLDHEDRVAAVRAQLLDQLRDLVRLGRVHPGGGLVEQEQARIGRHRAGDLQAAPVRVRERIRRLVPAVAHQPLAEEAELLLGEGSDRLLLTPHPGRPQDRAHDARPRVAVGRRRHVLLDRHVQEEPKRLERARDALAVDLVRREPDDRLALERDLSLVDLVHARHEVEERRLARAVRPDHAHDLVLVDVEVEVRDHLQAAEGLRDARELEHPRRHQMTSTFFWPKRPSGRIVITAISIAPNST